MLLSKLIIDQAIYCIELFSNDLLLHHCSFISGLLGVWLVPESPRWLISVGKDDKALMIVRDAAATNGLNPHLIFHKNVKLEDEHVEKSRFRDLWG